MLLFRIRIKQLIYHNEERGKWNHTLPYKTVIIDYISDLTKTVFTSNHLLIPFCCSFPKIKFEVTILTFFRIMYRCITHTIFCPQCWGPFSSGSNCLRLVCSDLAVFDGTDWYPKNQLKVGTWSPPREHCLYHSCIFYIKNILSDYITEYDFLVDSFLSILIMRFLYTL